MLLITLEVFIIDNFFLEKFEFLIVITSSAISDRIAMSIFINFLGRLRHYLFKIWVLVFQEFLCSIINLKKFITSVASLYLGILVFILIGLSFLAKLPFALTFGINHIPYLYLTVQCQIYGYCLVILSKFYTS